ncbi:hypothetical protein B0A55_09839 [Friedmanniomyces simplex]|uniref:Uncharacterized protein n=1 Tax=Friedmanniomyces simplex TaxID=329884 RepID=A0A4U0WWF1_9PEZI|nr:hypothetical protein B0A55_09839 [Friedmanniomyces simplex]
MPRVKRPLTEVDPNIDHEGDANKRLAAVLDARKSEKNPSPNMVALNAKERNEYICIDQPFWEFKEEHQALDEFRGDANPPRKLRQAWIKESERASTGRKWAKSAIECPGWNGVMMKEAWVQFDLLRRKSSYCDPFYFPTLDFYSHYHNWGINDLLDSQMVAFDAAYVRNDLDQMWCVVTAIAHWLSSEEGSFGKAVVVTLIGTDDGDGVCERVRVAGGMSLTALDAVDYAGEMKATSRFRDLGLVISLWLNWLWGLEKYGVGDDGECEWRKSVAVTSYKNVKALKRSGAKPGRWEWPKTFASLRGGDEEFGEGEHYDITKLSREESAGMSDDGKDPLGDVPEEHLLNSPLLFR